MSAPLNLDAIKADMSKLLAELGQTRTGQHLRCPFHQPDSTGSLCIWKGDDGAALWKCQAGCGKGTIIDAMMIGRKLGSTRAAIKELSEELGMPIKRSKIAPPPVVNKDRMERLIAGAHDKLMQSPEIQDRWMVRKRGIRSLDLMRQHRIGFLDGASFPEFRSWRIVGWTLPITDAGGIVRAVKIHNEIRSERMPKCLWAPYGIKQPHEDKARNGWATLWPPPEGQAGEIIYLCPGELKALALMGVGLAATSPTGGESAPLDELIGRIPHDEIVIVWDVEKDKRNSRTGEMSNPGREWRDRALKAVSAAGKEVRTMEFGALVEDARAAAESTPTAADAIETAEALWMAAPDEIVAPAAQESTPAVSDPERERLIALMPEGSWVSPAATMRDIEIMLIHQEPPETFAGTRWVHPDYIETLCQRAQDRARNE